MMSVEEVLVIGAGGFGLEVAQYSLDAATFGWPFRITGFLDDGIPTGTEVVPGLEVVGGTDAASLKHRNLLIAIGDSDIRSNISKRVRECGGQLVTLVHPTAYIAPTAKIGSGSLICPFATVSARAVVESNCVLNNYACVGHEAHLGDGSVLSPYSAILGRGRVGRSCFLGTCAAVGPGVSIGASSKLAAGSIALRDAAAGSMIVGNPAKSRVLFTVAPVEDL